MEYNARNITERTDFIGGIDNEGLDFCHLEQFIHDASTANSDTYIKSEQQEQHQQQQQQQQQHIQDNQIQTNISYQNSNSSDFNSYIYNNNNSNNSNNYKINNNDNKNVSQNENYNISDNGSNNSNNNSKCKNINNNKKQSLNNTNSNKNNQNNEKINDNKTYYINNSKHKNNNNNIKTNNKKIKNDDIISSNNVNNNNNNNTSQSQGNLNVPNYTKSSCDVLINSKNTNNNFIKTNNNNDNNIKNNNNQSTSIISNQSHLPESPPDSGSEPPFSPTDINSITGANVKFPIITVQSHYRQHQQQQQSDHTNTKNLNIVNFSQPPTPVQQFDDLTKDIILSNITHSNNLTNNGHQLSHNIKQKQSSTTTTATTTITIGNNLLLGSSPSSSSSSSSSNNTADYNNDQINNSFYNTRSDNNESSIIDQSVLTTKSDDIILTNEFQLLHQQEQIFDLERNYRDDLLNTTTATNTSSLNGNIHLMQITRNSQHNNQDGNNTLNVCNHSNDMDLINDDIVNRLIPNAYSTQLIPSNSASSSTNDIGGVILQDGVGGGGGQVANNQSLIINQQNDINSVNNQSLSQLSPPLLVSGGRKRKLSSVSHSMYGSQTSPSQKHQHQDVIQEKPNNIQHMDSQHTQLQDISIIKPEPSLGDSLNSSIIQANSNFRNITNEYHNSLYQPQSSPSSTSVNPDILNINSINLKLSSHSLDSELDSQTLQQQQQSQQQEQQQMNSSDLSDTCSLQCIRFSSFQQHNWHILVDQDLQELPIPYFRVDADKGFNFSNSDDAFVCQKKNHFQITCHAQLQGNSVFIKTSSGLEKIKSFHIHFYGVKVESVNQIIRVEQSQSDRSKKPFHPVLVDLQNRLVSKITVGRLHFSETTSNNMRKKGRPNPEQRYFQLVVGLYAHTHSSQYAVVVQGSERIIVRASNPGQFENDVELCWQRGLTQDSICHAGRVGINTDRPDESLVIHGNLKVSGHIVQPSDSRAKREISELDTAEQLRNLQKIRIVKYRYEPEFAIHSGLKKSYNYNINKYMKDNSNSNDLQNQMSNFISNTVYDDEDDTSEIIDTGVIAQELREVLPDAVKEAGSIVLPNGQVIENFLLVNKDRILMENIGAVKELCKVTGSLETRIEQLEKINSKILHIQQMDRSNCSKTPYKYLLNDYYNKKTSDEICSNATIQMIIIVLVIIMAVCLTAISTLYFVERAKKTYGDHSMYNHELIPSKNRIDDRNFKYVDSGGITTQSPYQHQIQKHNQNQHKKSMATSVTYTENNHEFGKIFEFSTTRFKNVTTTKLPIIEQEYYSITLTNNNNNNVSTTIAPFITITKQDHSEQKYFNLNGKSIVRKILNNHDNHKIKFESNNYNNISKSTANNGIEYGSSISGDANNNISSVEVTVPQDVENNSIDSDLIQKQSQKSLNVKPIKTYNKEIIKSDSKTINKTEQENYNDNLNKNIQTNNELNHDNGRITNESSNSNINDNITKDNNNDNNINDKIKNNNYHKSDESNIGDDDNMDNINIKDNTDNDNDNKNNNNNKNDNNNNRSNNNKNNNNDNNNKNNQNNNGNENDNDNHNDNNNDNYNNSYKKHNKINNNNNDNNSNNNNDDTKNNNQNNNNNNNNSDSNNDDTKNNNNNNDNNNDNNQNNNNYNNSNNE